MKFLTKFANPTLKNSLATKTRQKNFKLFKSLISTLPKPLKILDIGGTQQYWEEVNFTEKGVVEIMLLNLSKDKVSYPNFKSVIGDARNLSEFKDEEFDIVFSHSVIEHVGGLEEQRKMADEVRRVGRRYFLQTPNRFFPIEPHFLFPFFQFFPLCIKVWLVSHFDIGWYRRTIERQKVIEIVNSIRLLKEQELREFFPGAMIYKERFLGLTRSFLICGGWNTAPI